MRVRVGPIALSVFRPTNAVSVNLTVCGYGGTVMLWRDQHAAQAKESPHG